MRRETQTRASRKGEEKEERRVEGNGKAVCYILPLFGMSRGPPRRGKRKMAQEIGGGGVGAQERCWRADKDARSTRETETADSRIRLRHRLKILRLVLDDIDCLVHLGRLRHSLRCVLDTWMFENLRDVRDVRDVRMFGMFGMFGMFEMFGSNCCTTLWTKWGGRHNSSSFEATPPAFV